MFDILPRQSTSDPTRGTGLYIEETILTFLALLTTIVRVGVRLVNHQGGWDDATISAAMVSRQAYKRRAARGFV